MLSLEGKAGSGKSTLMKHIFDSLVQEYQMWGGDKLFVTTGNKPKARFLVVPAAGRCYSWSGKQSQGDARSDEETQKEELGEADMEHPDIVIVASYFFHARGGETSHCDMLHSLIYQIVSQDDRLFSACETRYRRLRKRNHDRSSVVVWEFEELKQAFQEIVRYQIRSEPHPLSIRYYFLIDALDESDDNKVEQIVSLFRHDLDASPHSIKTVLASRPIRNFASSQSAPSSLYTILEGENGGDIELYTDSEMDFLLHDTDNPDQASRTSLFLSITGYIKENARGVFLWVVLICRALKNYARNGYSAAGLNQELESLPKDLEGFYQMMTQSLASNLEPRALEEARKILNWTIFARRPLTIAEMRDIIAIPFGDGIQFSPSPSFLENHRVVGWQGVKQKMRHTCGDLVEIIHHNRGSSRIDENDSVQLIHQTVQEFLLQDNGVAKPLATNHSLGTEIILGVCARYLEVCFLNEVWSPSRTPRLWKSSRFGAGDYQQFTKALASLPLLWYILRHLFTHMQVGPLITLRNSHSEAIQAILKCFRDWNNSNQRHILFLLEKWIKERQEAVRDFDLSFLESVKPGVAAEFRSGCLLAAVQQNNKTIIVDMGELLGAGFQGKDLATANELLFAAAASGDDALMTGLLVAGAQEICHDDAGLTPLHHAAANGHAVVINRFSHGHNPLDRNGQTPLHFAASKGHVDALTALVRGGATITAKDNFGRTPLHLAVGAGHEAVIWQLVWHLIPGSVLRNAQDKDGETSLHYAARLGNAAIVIRLLSFRVDYELKNVHGQTAQDIAVQNGHHTVVDALQAWKDHEKVPAPSED
ncbi:hypothetical protein MMC30_000239 [Trapelia coarctata]|nr:hypothetical protein [Trapelia coarctata]